MSRIRHCLECPTCRLRYVISLSPYKNGSRVIAGKGGRDDYILYCACRRGASRWLEREVLLCDVSKTAYERGFGTREEIWCQPGNRAMRARSGVATIATSGIG
jgi:hypothetical protein